MNKTPTCQQHTNNKHVIGVLLVCWWVIGVLSVCCWYVGELSVCYRCVVSMLMCFWCVIDVFPYVGVLLVCCRYVGVLPVCWYVGVLLVSYGCVVSMMVCCRCVIAVCYWCVISVWGHLQLPQCVVALLGSFISATMGCGPFFSFKRPTTRCGNYSTSRTSCG